MTAHIHVERYKFSQTHTPSIKEMKIFCKSEITERTRIIAKNIFNAYISKGFFSSTFIFFYKTIVTVRSRHGDETQIGKREASKAQIEIGFRKNIMLRIKYAFGIDITKDIQEITNSALEKLDSDTKTFANGKIIALNNIGLGNTRQRGHQ